MQVNISDDVWKVSVYNYQIWFLDKFMFFFYVVYQQCEKGKDELILYIDVLMIIFSCEFVDKFSLN